MTGNFIILINIVVFVVAFVFLILSLWLHHRCIQIKNDALGYYKKDTFSRVYDELNNIILYQDSKELTSDQKFALNIRIKDFIIWAIQNNIIQIDSLTEIEKELFKKI